MPNYCSTAVIDEFATGLDVEGGRALAARVGGYVRRKGWRRVVLATTRDDLVGPLAPDWTLSTKPRGDLVVFAIKANDVSDRREAVVGPPGPGPLDAAQRSIPSISFEPEHLSLRFVETDGDTWEHFKKVSC